MTVVLALLAILVPASVALVGYWAKNQSETRLRQETEQNQLRLDQDRKQNQLRLDQDRKQNEARLAQEHMEQQARLRLDAAMRAAALFGTADNVPPNPASSASGLLALTELGRADLAVALLVELWSVPHRPGSRAEGAGRASSAPSTEATTSDGSGDSAVAARPGSVSNETAVLVINAALKTTDSPGAQLVAAELLCRNAIRLDPCQSLHWPAAINGQWIPDLPTMAKLLIMEGLVDMTCYGDASENALRTLAVRLYGVWTGDSANKRVQGCVGHLVQAILPALKDMGYTEFLQLREPVTLDQLVEAANSAATNPDGYLEKMVTKKCVQLEKWSKGCTSCEFVPGAWGTAALSSATS
jgi:hypothetical protein